MRRARGGSALLVAVALTLTLVSVPTVAHAQTVCAGIDRGLVPFNDESLPVSSTAVGLTQSKMSAAGGVNAVAARVEIKTAAVYVRELQSTPTATLSSQYAAGSRFWVCGASLTSVRFLRVSSDATAFITYYRSN